MSTLLAWASKHGATGPSAKPIAAGLRAREQRTPARPFLEAVHLRARRVLFGAQMPLTRAAQPAGEHPHWAQIGGRFGSVAAELTEPDTRSLVGGAP